MFHSNDYNQSYLINSNPLKLCYNIHMNTNELNERKASGRDVLRASIDNLFGQWVMSYSDDFVAALLNRLADGEIDVDGRTPDGIALSLRL